MGAIATPSILLTHPRAANRDALIANLQAIDAEVLYLPLLSVFASQDSGVIKQVASIRAGDVLVFTSKNGVKYFLDLCNKLQLSFVANEVYALGSKTAEAAEQSGFAVTFVGSGESSTTFAEEIIKRDAVNQLGHPTAKRYVLLRGERASNELPQLLVSNGFGVEKIAVYQSLKVELDGDEMRQLKSWLSSVAPSKLVVFTSPLAAEIFCNHLQQLSEISALATIDVAVIGSTTHDFVANLGFRNIFVPQKATIEDLSNLLFSLVE